MKYIVDPYIFSFRDDMSEDELNDYVETISDLDEWWKNHKDEMYVLSETGDLLYEHGIYPLANKLSPLLEKYDSEFEYKDISRMLNHYIEQSIFIDDVCQDECIEKTEEELVTDLTNEIGTRPDAFKDAFMNILWFSFCMHLIDDKESESYAVFSKAFDKPVTVEYRYDHIDTDVDPDNPIPDKEKTVIYCHSSLDAFKRDANTPLFMWKYSNCKSDLDFGLRSMVLQEDGLDDFSDIDKKYHFMLQDSFYEDFCNNHYARKPSDIKSALESITKVIKDIRHGKEHNMRTGPGPNDPYLYHIEYTDHRKILNKYSGMRKKVTTSIKLMYWKNTPYYQFARIAEHDYYDLPWEDYEWNRNK